MELPVPPAFHLELDTTRADWLLTRLKPWGKERVRVCCFVPDVFEAYVRVLHPAHRGSWNQGTIRWSEIAERNGVTIGPSTSFREVSGIHPETREWDEASPSDGSIDREQLEAMAALLAPFTRTPERCWVAAWEGWGSWGPGSSATLTATLGGPPPAKIGRRERKAMDRAVEDARRKLDAIPRIIAEHRAYFLFSARLEDAPSFEIGGFHHQSPSIWWPDDRAWCVATEIDGYSTYVGGSAACIAALLASDRIEAIGVTPDTPMDPGPY